MNDHAGNGLRPYPGLFSPALLEPVIIGQPEFHFSLFTAAFPYLFRGGTIHSGNERLRVSR